MNMKRKIMAVIWAAALGLCLSGCGNDTPEARSVPADAAVDEEAVPGESIQTNGGEVIALADLAHQDEDADALVYYTSNISPEAVTAVYDALGQELSGERIAVKLSTGEPPASNYLDPQLIADLVHQVNGTIVENNTAYGGQRASTAMHYQVAEDHGFTDIADFVVLDEEALSLCRWKAERGCTKTWSGRISRNMTVTLSCLTSRGMPWPVLAVRSRTSLSAWLLRKESV